MPSVLGGWAFSYERGTPVEGLNLEGVAGVLLFLDVEEA